MTSPRTTESSAYEVRLFITPKRGHTLSECEDSIGTNSALNRFAVADGATEAFDSGNWAQRLTRNWIEATGLLKPDDFWQWIENEGKDHRESWSSLELPWYSREKEQAGSYAAFVGVELDLQKAAPQWNAIALGDSCLIHTRDQLVIDAFPLSNPADFGWAPILAPSRTSANSHARTGIVTKSGPIETGDELLLLSDAAAAWYLALNVEARFELSGFLNIEDNLSVTQFMEQHRLDGRLKNDDVAIIKIGL